jgi:hypothetical protein
MLVIPMHDILVAERVPASDSLVNGVVITTKKKVPIAGCFTDHF